MPTRPDGGRLPQAVLAQALDQAAAQGFEIAIFSQQGTQTLNLAPAVLRTNRKITQDDVKRIASNARQKLRAPARGAHDVVA